MKRWFLTNSSKTNTFKKHAVVIIILIPDYLYYSSGSNNNLSTDYIITVDMSDITLAKSFTKSPHTFGCNEKFSKLAMIIILRQNLSMPKTVSEAETLFIKTFRQTNISYSLIHTSTCTYQEDRNVSFSKNFANVLN